VAKKAKKKLDQVLLVMFWKWDIPWPKVRYINGLYFYIITTVMLLVMDDLETMLYEALKARQVYLHGTFHSQW